MIRRVEIIYRKIGTWARGNSYECAPITPLNDGDVVFRRNYPKGTPTSKIWNEIRIEMSKYFFITFFPSVIWKTPISGRPYTNWKHKTTPEGRHAWISPSLDRKMSSNPDLYRWNKKMKKWHMDSDKYIERTVTKGGEIDIGVATSDYETMYDYSLLDDMQRKVELEKRTDRTFSIVLFIYPDKYDAEVRAMYELKITFW